MNLAIVMLMGIVLGYFMGLRDGRRELEQAIERYETSECRQIALEAKLAEASSLGAAKGETMKKNTGSDNPENVCKFHGSDNQTEGCTLCFCEGKESVSSLGAKEE